ncbi:MAG: ABC transporter ATP-binding protein [Planctomycetota bacterium]|jgi:ABC-2 type transport system ATP-binding protein
MSEPVIRIEGLRFSYGHNKVLRGVDLEVPTGSIFGFLGRNAAGKTTTIKLLLGLLRPQAGVCMVNGLDSHRSPMAVRRGVGYMAEDQQMFGWMRIEQIVKWVGSFYQSWDDRLTAELLDVLELPKTSKVKTLSKGQNSRLALLLALGHRPEVVILDDPTLGLDPIARKDFLRYVIDLLQSDGVTVFFSSHLLYEIEPVADHVAILDRGVIIKTGKTDLLRESVRKFIVAAKPGADLGRVGGVLDVVKLGENALVTVEDCDQAKRAAIKEMTTDGLQEMALNLDEIFEAYVIGNRGKGVSV